jgi:hypothetical protein
METHQSHCTECWEGFSWNEVPFKVIEEPWQPPHHDFVIVPSLHKLSQHKLVMLFSQSGQDLQKNISFVKSVHSDNEYMYSSCSTSVLMLQIRVSWYICSSQFSQRIVADCEQFFAGNNKGLYTNGHLSLQTQKQGKGKREAPCLHTTLLTYSTNDSLYLS